MTFIDRVLLVTHRGCLDGTGSALMFTWAGGDPGRVLFRPPSGLQLRPEDLAPDVEDVWYVDCCPHDLTDPAAGRPFRVFDHHVSSQRLHGGDPRCTFDMDESGTSLLARHLGLTGMGQYEDEFIAAMRDYDLGRFENRAGVRLADLASTFTQEALLELFIAMDSLDLLRDPKLTARADGAAAARRIFSEHAARAAAGSSLKVGDGRSVSAAAIAAPRDWKNDVAQRILETRGVDVAVVIDVIGGMVSLRSLPGGPDCSEIAGLYGGGGHARAAGFRIPKGTHGAIDLLMEGAFG